MSFKEIKINPHLIIESFLFLIIIFLFNQKAEVLINPKPLPKDAVLNFSLLIDKSIVVTDNKGVRLNEEAKNYFHENKDKNLHTIAISIESDYLDNKISENILNMVIAPANAAHIYKVKWNSDGQSGCYWIDDYHKCKPH